MLIVIYYYNGNEVVSCPFILLSLVITRLSVSTFNFLLNVLKGGTAPPTENKHVLRSISK